MNEKVYVFDLGNVIVIPMNVKLLYEKLECKVSYDEFLEFFKKDKSVIDAHAGIISDDKHIEKILEFAKSNKTIDEYKEIYCGPIRNSLYKDTIDIIDSLKKHHKKVCMLSNLRKIDFDWFSTVYDITKFDELFLSYEMHLNKPDKRIYQEMIYKLNVKPEDIYFFDDSKTNVDVAIECGINAFCVTGENIKGIFDNELKLEING